MTDIGTNIKEFCYICRMLNHNTDEHICHYCDIKGEHSSTSCPTMIKCELCKSRTHTTMEHKCKNCGGNHLTDYCHLKEKCIFCQMTSHTLLEHKCHICNAIGNHDATVCPIKDEFYKFDEMKDKLGFKLIYNVAVLMRHTDGDEISAEPHYRLVKGVDIIIDKISDNIHLTHRDINIVEGKLIVTPSYINKIFSCIPKIKIIEIQLVSLDKDLTSDEIMKRLQ